jgi:phosphatidate phosphatase APP1
MRRRALLQLSIAAGLAVGLGLADAHAGSEVKDDETVVLFATTAAREGDGWSIPVHGWIGELEPDSRWRGTLVSWLRRGLGRDPTEAEAVVLRDRLVWFLADAERGKRVEIEIAGQRATMAPSGKDGQFRGRLRVPAQKGVATTLAIGARARDGRRFAATVALLDGPGLAVISDIDDTIKVTEVLDRKRMLARTFLREFEAVDGMAELYAGWAAAGLPVFYVSGSPWQLYVPLRDWIARAGFPAGEIALREFRVKDGRRWNLLEPADAHKLAAIRDLLRRFPDRRFVLVGDAGERDPEIYGIIARESPRRIERILIRRLPGDRMTEARWRRALGKAASKALAFEAVADLPAELRRLDGR